MLVGSSPVATIAFIAHDVEAELTVPKYSKPPLSSCCVFRNEIASCIISELGASPAEIKAIMATEVISTLPHPPSSLSSPIIYSQIDCIISESLFTPADIKAKTPKISS